MSNGTLTLIVEGKVVQSSLFDQMSKKTQERFLSVGPKEDAETYLQKVKTDLEERGCPFAEENISRLEYDQDGKVVAFLAFFIDEFGRDGIYLPLAHFNALKENMDRCAENGVNTIVSVENSKTVQVHDQQRIIGLNRHQRRVLQATGGKK